VFADINKDSFVVDPVDIEKKISKKTKCVIVVDYAGQSPDYDFIKRICKRKNIALIEDGAPGLGGKYNTKALCSMGDINITSFHMAKVFTSVEGGMIFTDNKQYAKIARILRSQGEDPDKKYFHPYVGHNYRMSDLHAAVGIAQIRRFRKVLSAKAKSAEYYTKNLKNIENIKTPYVNSYNKHAWFLYPILVEKREKVRRYLIKKGIQTNVSWPLPIYKQKPYLKYAGKRCVNAEYVTKKILCLPLYYNITKKEQRFVVDKLKEAMVA